MLKLSKAEKGLANDFRKEYFEHRDSINTIMNRGGYNLSSEDKVTIKLHKNHMTGIVKYLQTRLSLCHKDALMHVIYG
jgi:hypothetical protein|tara:strand:- start:278 stop:511 length:234 start_codon:yes stop_codon:yes gene_type:complete